MTENEVQDSLLTFFKALGQKDRLAIAGQLIPGPLTVPELSRRLDLKEMDLLHHLSLMQESGLVGGNEERYWFDVDALHALNRRVWPAVRPPAPKGEGGEEVIVQRYLRDGRLTDLPMKENKLEIVLRWVADQIAPDRTFTEKEISAILGEIYPDYAMLRRYLVDYGLMAREKGIYWRVQE